MGKIYDCIENRCDEGITVYERVRSIMRREWRCVFDLSLLEGMVYESILGRRKASALTLGECRAMHGLLGLPSLSEISEASREAVGSWEKS